MAVTARDDTRIDSCSLYCCTVHGLPQHPTAELNAGELFGHSPSRVAAVYGLMTCATDSPPPICKQVARESQSPAVVTSKVRTESAYVVGESFVLTQCALRSRPKWPSVHKPLSHLSGIHAMTNDVWRRAPTSAFIAVR